MTPRAQLESDLLFMRRNYANCDGPLAGIIKAAEERLEAMPKTKVIEVRRWVAFSYYTRGDEHGISFLSAYSTEHSGMTGQWVTFKVEVPA